jgi:hypothetical protein
LNEAGIGSAILSAGLHATAGVGLAPLPAAELPAALAALPAVAGAAPPAALVDAVVPALAWPGAVPMAIAGAIEVPGPAGLAAEPPLAAALPGVFAVPLAAARPAAPVATAPPLPVLGAVVVLVDVGLPVPESAGGASLPHAVGSAAASISELNTAVCCARTKAISTFFLRAHRNDARTLMKTLPGANRFFDARVRSAQSRSEIKKKPLRRTIVCGGTSTAHCI